MYNEIRLDASALRPSTLAAMIADLFEAGSLKSDATDYRAIRSLLNQLEECVGVDDSIDYLCDEGIEPEMVYGIF